MNSILMDPTNGEIYAAASLPLLNPADLSTAEEGATDLKCISTTFEPGSTFKSFAVMSMLEDNALTPDTQIYCPYSIEADGFTIKDAKDRSSQTFTLREILARSSNVGVSLATEMYGWDRYHDKFSKYKILDQTEVDYPGDNEGYVLDFSKWSKIHAYNISFGQGVSVTPLQISKFYSAIANGGVEKTPHFLMRYLQAERDEEYDEYEIIDNKNAIPTMLSMLRSVVTDGTGELAEIPGYGVVGKTGTGEIADSNGEYIEGSYFSSFIGFLNSSNVPMLCFVGGEKAPTDTTMTPVWKEIMTATIERLKLAAKGS